MKHISLVASAVIFLAGANTQAKILPYDETQSAVQEEINKGECSVEISIDGICQDIDALYAIIITSINDSNYSSANSALVPYKRMPCEMRLLLSTRKTINGIAYSSLLHEAAKGNNYAISAAIFQKASNVGNAEYLPFAKELANAVDSDGKKPVDYATNPQLISLLTTF
ncbi:MAG: hypothetical protein KC505_09320, partial [Myxococcales bacterium]|nr:hypothetical protein [Myxococcales bacterium]